MAAGDGHRVAAGQAQDETARGTGKIIRYADDFVLMVSGDRRHAEALREEVAAVLAPLGLRLSPEKTRVVHIDEGFTSSASTSAASGNGEPRSTTSTPSRPEGHPVDQGQGEGQDVQVNPPPGPGQADPSLNRSLAGWANYFRHGVSKAMFSAVDYHRVASADALDTRQVQRASTGLGMKELRRRFCDQGWRFACNGVVFTGASSVAVTRYRYRGSTIPTPGPRHRQPRQATDQRARHVERPVR